VAKKNDHGTKSHRKVYLSNSNDTGAYVVLHGHLSPGGGFQGGVILGGVAALVFLVFGADAVLHRFNLEKYTLMEALGGIGFAGAAIIGLWKTVFYGRLSWCWHNR